MYGRYALLTFALVRTINADCDSGGQSVSTADEQCLLQVNVGVKRRSPDLQKQPEDLHHTSVPLSDRKPSDVDWQLPDLQKRPEDLHRTRQISDNKTSDVDWQLIPLDAYDHWRPRTDKESEQHRYDSGVLGQLHSLHFRKTTPRADRWGLSETIQVVVAFLILVVADLCVLQRTKSHQFTALVLMVVLSLAHLLFVWRHHGAIDGKDWSLAWILEIALSMDNLFAFYLVFKSYRLKDDDIRWVLTAGMYGAIMLRLPFILFFSEIFRLRFPVALMVGPVLVVAGLLALDNDSTEDDVECFFIVRLLKWNVGSRFRDPAELKLKDMEDNVGLFLEDEESGDWQFGKLLMVACMVSVLDLACSLDSTAAKTGAIKNRYINLSSSLLAMFTLRCMFFIVEQMIGCFDFVKYGACTILLFVGVEMMIDDWINVPSMIFFCIVAAIFFTSAGASWIQASRSRSAELMLRRSQAEEALECLEGTPRDSTGGDMADASPKQPRRNPDGPSSTEDPFLFTQGAPAVIDDPDDVWKVLDTPPGTARGTAAMDSARRVL